MYLHPSRLPIKYLASSLQLRSTPFLPTCRHLHLPKSITRPSEPLQLSERKPDSPNNLLWTLSSKTDFGNSTQKLAAYIKFRERYPHLLANIHPETFVGILEQGCASEFIVERVVEDVTTRLINPGIRSNAIRMLLEPASRNPRIANKHILSLFRSLSFKDLAEPLSTPVFARVTRAIIANGPLTSDDVEVLTSLVPRYISEWSQGHWNRSPFPQNPLGAALSTLSAFLPLEDHRPAYTVLEHLAQAGALSVEAVNSEDIRSHSFRAVVFRAVLETMLSYNWYQDAALLFQHSPYQMEDSPELRNRLVTKLLYHILGSSNTRESLHLCASLIATVGFKHPCIILPDELVFQLYQAMHDQKYGEGARKMFETFHSREQMKVHAHPPPCDHSASFLMHYILTQTRKTHTARRLADQLVHSQRSLDITVRSRIIRHCAESGFLAQAKALWLRYTAGDDGAMVAGSVGTMIKMVKLAMKQVERFPKAKEEHLEFARLVVTRFKQTQDLPNAPHMHLTGYAHVCNLVGYPEGCVEAMGHLMHRGEVPDLYDINIMLDAVAKRDPSRAFGMLKRMMEKGVGPNEVTFSTLVNAALQHGSVKLAMEVMQLAEESGYPRMSESVVSTVANQLGEKDPDLELWMEWAYSVARGAQGAMSVSVGKRCMELCIRGGLIELGFLFWEDIVKDGTEWTHWGSAVRRQEMAEEIRKQCQEGVLGGEVGDRMLSKLGSQLRGPVGASGEEPGSNP